jgi:phosphatidylglycerophosphatase A
VSGKGYISTHVFVQSRHDCGDCNTHPARVLLSGFVLHRIFDITKPPPIRQLQHIHGGFGIVIDDFLAAIIALGLNHLIFALLS